jgi:hypothetical protein
MRTQDFSERVAALYKETAGGKQLYVAGHTAMRQAVVIGNIFGPGDRPFLYAVHAGITDITSIDERLHVSMFPTGPEARQVHWTRQGSMGRVILNNNVSGTRLVLPVEGLTHRIIVDGAPLSVVPNMIPGIQPPQALPATLEIMSEQLLQNMPAKLSAAA